ncbi:DsbE family thiol:disulfide interchange protein [Amorphus sp. 3PC139-8]|uniref:DsbE family thiol:disulfide interchange protein n=1 Tax=Amorphus sp. 3PC139-8 TaxID=2735676 RepID=UPI00345D39BD
MTSADTTPEDGEPRRRRPWLLVVPLILFVALAGVFLVRLVSGDDPSKIPSALIGKSAPATTLPPLPGLMHDGAPVPGLDPADFQGRVTLVNVFASWCAPCRVEHHMLVTLSEDEGVRLVGIDYKDETENALRFLGTFGNPFDAVGVDADGRAAIEWGVYGVPETFVVGPDGKIRYKFVGPLDDEALDGAFGAAIAAAKADAAKAGAAGS